MKSGRPYELVEDANCWVLLNRTGQVVSTGNSPPPLHATTYEGRPALRLYSMVFRPPSPPLLEL